QRGCEGIEAKYDRYLFGTAGKQRTRVDAQRRLLESSTVERIAPEGGADVYLTINKPLQYTLESELAIALEEFKAARAMGMLMDPYTGAILALANVPSFDPNEYNEVPAELRKNRALIDVFEPGSAFKVITAAAALEEGLIRPDTMIDCEMGRFNPYGHTINDVHKLGVVPFSQAFAESSNVGFVKVAALLGPERLADWIATFGFGKPACADVQVESGGIFRPLEKWSRLSMGALPIGQEIAATMPQMLRAYAVLANGGHLVEPYLVDKVVSRDGMVLYRHEFSTRKRILSEETSHMMRDLCHLVIAAEHGTGRHARIPDFRACGKTGTAQIAKPNGGGYYDKKYTAVFAGFAPLAAPRICAVIVVQEPVYGRHYGGLVSGPVFKKVVRQALIHMNVTKDPMSDEVPVVAVLEPRPVPRPAGGGSEDAAVPAPAPTEPVPDPDAGREYLASLPRTIVQTPSLDLTPIMPRHQSTEGSERADEIEESESADNSGFPEEAPPDDPDTVVARESIALLEPTEEESLADLDGLELVASKTDIPSVGPALPDLLGMTKRQAKEALESLGLRWDVRGSGWVVSQEPAAGTPVNDVRLCRLVFDSKRDTASRGENES
ncbi:MAG: PASTA domain-containing protein, partial [bacterium]|nr:PASTA domain-containing protein [bacterium]